MNKLRHVFLFVSHLPSGTIIKEFKNIRRSTEQIGDTFFLYDTTGKTVPDKINTLSPYLYSTECLSSLGYPAIGQNIIPGHAHFPLFQFFLDNPTYDHYWVIEYDVRFSGDWQFFFDPFLTTNADFLTCHIRSYADEPCWPWWELHHPQESIPLHERLRSFNPVYRISNAALSFLHRAFRSGWSGHHEVVLPTLLNHNDFIIKEISGEGNYTVPGMENKFYASSEPNCRGELFSGTMRYRPAFWRYEPEKNKLYHPVKPLHCLKASIIIPCFNQANYLPEAVESVVNQTFSDWECIIVNDGSEDNTGEVARGLIARFPEKRIRLLEKANGGLADARNYGIRRSFGEYILPLDADDKLESLMLEKVVALLDNNPEADVAYTDLRFFGTRSGIHEFGELISERLALANQLPYCSLYRRHVWKVCGGYNPNMVFGYEDWDFWVGCTSKGFRGMRIPEPLFWYRTKEHSMITQSLQHDVELRAQIVLNHPDMYGDDKKRWAEDVLKGSLPASQARRKNIPGNRSIMSDAPSNFRVIAIISTYNEEDIIVSVINHLVNEDVDVYVIDNWSTDRTFDLINQIKRGVVGIERWPSDGPSPNYNWEEILKRKEALGQELETDWFINHDADEIRESPWKGIKLRDAIYLADQQGYNAIDFALLNFFPVDNGYQQGSSLDHYFKYYQYNDLPANEIQIKAWKKTKQHINLWKSGGHSAEFYGRKIFPFKFIMRHYPIRSQSHGEKKVIYERQVRFNPLEREKGWHIQYDHYSNGTSFLKKPGDLIKVTSGFYNEFLLRQMISREHVVQSLNDQLAEQAGQLAGIKREVAERDEQIIRLNQTLNNIYHSHGWKALAVFYRVRNKFFPRNTKRRLFVKLIVNTITNPKNILKNITITNLKKFLYYFRTIEPSMVEQKIGKKILYKSEAAETKPLQVEFQENIPFEKIEDLSFPYYDQPLVSIIIPVCNKWRYTYRCLRSVLENTEQVPYEIIIADDTSTDETPAMLSKVKGATIIHNQTNSGFVKNCNNAVKYSKGKYLLFLNNDTEVKKGWLQSLVEIAERDEKTGVVGGKILYPDGSLQEAGSVMDKYGWSQPYGRSASPDRYEFNYVKEVDLLTGVCMLIRKSIFLELSGFDERYAPAFFEEFDLECAIREAGFKIMYQPKAVIMHHDASSYGIETRNALSFINHAKFMKKWGNLISHQFEQREIFLARDRSNDKKVLLFIDLEVDYDKHAGSLSTYKYITLLHEMGFKVIFITDLLTPSEPYTTELQQLGVEVVYGQFEFKKFLQQNGRHIDYVWLARPDVAIKYIKAVKRNTKAKILYFTHDLHYLRELRRYQIEKRKEILHESNRLKEIEFFLFKNVDLILTPSDQEQKIIQENFPDKRVAVIPLYYYEPDSVEKRYVPDFEQRNGLFFLGGMGHLPNIDAVQWFLDAIYPHIRKNLADVKLYIAGSNPPPEIMALGSPDVIVAGYVKELLPLFEKCRIFVSPLRYGAGVKGKIVTSLYHGLPVVNTSMGNEGLNLKHDVEALIADDPIKFADAVVELYTNAPLWDTLSKNSMTFVKNNFSKDKAKQVMLETFDILKNK